MNLGRLIFDAQNYLRSMPHHLISTVVTFALLVTTPAAALLTRSKFNYT